MKQGERAVFVHLLNESRMPSAEAPPARCRSRMPSRARCRLHRSAATSSRALPSSKASIANLCSQLRRRRDRMPIGFRIQQTFVAASATGLVVIPALVFRPVVFRRRLSVPCSTKDSPHV